jgi:kynurenine formamidase
MVRFYDLSQPIKNGMPVLRGDPVPDIQVLKSIPDPWSVSALFMGSHTGTHVDAPSHFYPAGRTIDGIEIERFVVPGLVVPALGLNDDQPIGPELFEKTLSRLTKGSGVIVRTDWSDYWGTERYFHHPFLLPEAAVALVLAGAGIVGIDTPSVDSTIHETDGVHELLLGNDVLIVENLTGLAQLRPGTMYQFSFLPLLFPGLDGSPVRAVATEIEQTA